MVQAQKAAEHKTFEVTKAETRPYLEILKHGYDGDIHIKLTSRDDKNPESIKRITKTTISEFQANYLSPR